MPSDWYFTTDSARNLVESLEPGEREVWDMIIEDLLQDPWPDAVRKLPAPAPPFPEGAIGIASGLFGSCIGCPQTRSSKSWQ